MSDRCLNFFFFFFCGHCLVGNGVWGFGSSIYGVCGCGGLVLILVLTLVVSFCWCLYWCLYSTMRMSFLLDALLVYDAYCFLDFFFTDFCPYYARIWLLTKFCWKKKGAKGVKPTFSNIQFLEVRMSPNINSF